MNNLFLLQHNFHASKIRRLISLIFNSFGRDEKCSYENYDANGRFYLYRYTLRENKIYLRIAQLLGRRRSGDFDYMGILLNAFIIDSSLYKISIPRRVQFKNYSKFTYVDTRYVQLSRCDVFDIHCVLISQRDRAMSDSVRENALIRV